MSHDLFQQRERLAAHFVPWGHYCRQAHGQELRSVRAIESHDGYLMRDFDSVLVKETHHAHSWRIAENKDGRRLFSKSMPETAATFIASLKAQLTLFNERGVRIQAVLSGVVTKRREALLDGNHFEVSCDIGNSPVIERGQSLTHHADSCGIVDGDLVEDRGVELTVEDNNRKSKPAQILPDTRRMFLLGKNGSGDDPRDSQGHHVANSVCFLLEIIGGIAQQDFITVRLSGILDAAEDFGIHTIGRVRHP